MNGDKRAELLMKHYEDTFQHILYHWKVRNRLFMYALILLFLMALDTYSPGSISQLVNEYVKKLVKSYWTQSVNLNFSILGSAAWFLLLCLVIQYYQRSIHVDRQYRYIDDIERKLCKLMGGDFITREGKAYMTRLGVYSPKAEENRPLYLKAVGPLYVYFFPVVLISFIITKIIKENFGFSQVTIDIFNIVVGVIIIIYSVFYVIWVIKKK